MGKTVGTYKCFTDKIYTHIDEESQSLVSIDFDHSQIHAGNTFFYINYHNVLASASIDFVLEVGAKEVHFIFAIGSDQGGTSLVTYEGVTVTAGTGTILTAYNQNRESNIVSTAVAKLNPTVATITTETRLRRSYAGVGGTPSSRLGGSIVRGSEVILKPNTKYLLRITNLNTNAANDINVTMQWYEV